MPFTRAERGTNLTAGSPGRMRTLDGEVHGAGSLAFDEYVRSTLADHAAAYPNQWVGITSVDDTCWSFYSSDPGRCGGVLGITNYEGQNTEQPNGWSWARSPWRG